MGQSGAILIERPIPGGTGMFVVAEDSNVAEPLCELYPRIKPSIGIKARGLTGSKSLFPNARAKEILGWKPVHSWRHLI